MNLGGVRDLKELAIIVLVYCRHVTRALRLIWYAKRTARDGTTRRMVATERDIYGPY